MNKQERWKLNKLTNLGDSFNLNNTEFLRKCFDSTDGMVSFEEACLLYKLAREADGGCIVELGSYRGRSSTFLGLGSLDGNQLQIFTIDPHQEFTGILGGKFGPSDRTAFYQTMLRNGLSEIVSLINLSSEYFSSKWNMPVALLWIDGDHSYTGVCRDFECWSPHLTESAIVAFDDAINKDIGPRQLIDQLVAEGVFTEILKLGKIAVLQRTYQLGR